MPIPIPDADTKIIADSYRYFGIPLPTTYKRYCFHREERGGQNAAVERILHVNLHMNSLKNEHNENFLSDNFKLYFFRIANTFMVKVMKCERNSLRNEDGSLVELFEIYVVMK